MHWKKSKEMNNFDSNQGIDWIRNFYGKLDKWEALWEEKNTKKRPCPLRNTSVILRDAIREENVCFL